MATYLFYDPDLGGWLSRDPLPSAEMEVAPNLYDYVNNRPLYLIDPLGLEAEIYVFRTGRFTPASAFVYQDGQYVGSTFANAGGFYPNSRPRPDGTYPLLPRTDAQPGDKFADGTPRVMDLDFVHPDSESKGCLTVPLDWADWIWDMMDANADDGGTTVTYTTQPYPKAIPVDPLLPQATQHVWPGFHLKPPYPFPYPYR